MSGPAFVLCVFYFLIGIAIAAMATVTMDDDAGTAPRPRTLFAIGVAWPIALVVAACLLVATLARALWRNEWEP